MSILSYSELSYREGTSLQKGMTYRTDGRPSVFLMSTRTNAPYRDRFDGEILVYEGHDPSGINNELRKISDQPMYLGSGKPTENGKFYAAAKRKLKICIQVYEKIRPGIWFDKGLFRLVDAVYRYDGERKVFNFYLMPIDIDQSSDDTLKQNMEYQHERLIPTRVKVEVYKRDKGKCIDCGATDGLHFDHILPFSRGGRSDDARNIQLLCARHNLQKGSKII